MQRCVGILEMKPIFGVVRTCKCSELSCLQNTNGFYEKLSFSVAGHEFCVGKSENVIYLPKPYENDLNSIKTPSLLSLSTLDAGTHSCLMIAALIMNRIFESHWPARKRNAKTINKRIPCNLPNNRQPFSTTPSLLKVIQNYAVTHSTVNV